MKSVYFKKINGWLTGMVELTHLSATIGPVKSVLELNLTWRTDAFQCARARTSASRICTLLQSLCSAHVCQASYMHYKKLPKYHAQQCQENWTISNFALKVLFWRSLIALYLHQRLIADFQQLVPTMNVFVRVGFFSRIIVSIQS